MLPELPLEILVKILHYLDVDDLIQISCVDTCLSSVVHSKTFLDNYIKSYVGFTVNIEDFPKPNLPELLWYNTSKTTSTQCHNTVTNTATWNDELHILALFKQKCLNWLAYALDNSYRQYVKGKVIASQFEKNEYLIDKLLRKMHKTHITLFYKFIYCFPNLVDFLNLNPLKQQIIDSGPNELNDVIKTEEYLQYLETSDLSAEFIASSMEMWSLGAFLICICSDICVCWSGTIDYSTFSHRATFGICKFSIHASLSEIKRVAQPVVDGLLSAAVIEKPIAIVHPEFIACESTLEYWTAKFIQRIEKKAAQLSTKTKATYTEVSERKFISFLDNILSAEKKANKRPTSATLKVAVLRCLHRILNKIFMPEIMCYFSDRNCHFTLCDKHERSIKGFQHGYNIAVCLMEKSIHNIPPRVWPPHLVAMAFDVVPVISKMVQLDIVLLHKQKQYLPLSSNVKVFDFVLASIRKAGLVLEKNPVAPIMQCIKLPGQVEILGVRDFMQI